MCDEIRALQQEVYIISRCALHGILRHRYPRRILGRRPVQLWCHEPAELFDGILDLLVDFGKGLGGIRIRIFVPTFGCACVYIR